MFIRSTLWIFASLTPLAPVVARAADTVSGPALILDGDTAEIGGTRVRFDGIDAPETDQVCLDARGQQWACGILARDVLVAIAAGQSRFAVSFDLSLTSTAAALGRASPARST